MKIVYYSLTGNTKSFVDRFVSEGFEVVPIQNGRQSINDPFVLITPTYEFGKVPEIVQRFLEENSNQMRAVVSTGNRNWGGFFGKAGDAISAAYGVPLIRKIELRGTDDDFNIVKERLENDDRIRR